MMTNVNQVYRYYTIIFIVSLALLKDVNVMFSMNIDAQAFYIFLLSITNQQGKKKVSSLLKIRKKK